MVECPLCLQKLLRINANHCKTHGLTVSEFRELTGLTQLVDTPSIVRRIKAENHPLLGKIPDYELATLCGISCKTAAKVRLRKGLPPLHSEYLSQEGLYLRSSLEAMYDAYLHELGVEHEHEVYLTDSCRYRADFKVGDLFIEIRGMGGYRGYDDKQAHKEAFYVENNLKVVWILPPAVCSMYKNCKTVQVLPICKKECIDCGKESYRLTQSRCVRCYKRSKLYSNVCEGCGKVFTSVYGTRRFCSTAGKACKDLNELIELGERILSIRQVLKENGIYHQLYRARLRLGWSKKDAATIPIRALRPKRGRKDRTASQDKVRRDASKILKLVESCTIQPLKVDMRPGLKYCTAVVEYLRVLGVTGRVALKEKTKGKAAKKLITKRYQIVLDIV